MTSPHGKGHLLARLKQEMGRGPFSTGRQYTGGEGDSIAFLFQLMTSRRQAERARKHTHSQIHTHTHTEHRLLIRPTGHAGPRFCMLGLDSSWLRFCMDQTVHTTSEHTHTQCTGAYVSRQAEERVQHCATTLPQSLLQRAVNQQNSMFQISQAWPPAIFNSKHVTLYHCSRVKTSVPFAQDHERV